MDVFEKRLRSASTAAWYVVAVAAGFLTVVWLIYLGIANTRPAWMLSMLGPEVTWALFARICLFAIAAFKCAIWLMAMASLWLTLWARQLRKTDRA